MYLTLGTGRSGTTAAARIMETRLGIDMGGPGRKSASNPGGDYERRWARNLTLEYLRGFRPLDSWRYEMQLRSDEMDEADQPWGIKSPIACMMIDEWLALYPDARIIWAQRSLEKTLASYMKWYNQGESRARLDIGARTHALQAALRDREHLVIDFTERRSDAEVVRLIAKRWPALHTPRYSL